MRSKTYNGDISFCEGEVFCDKEFFNRERINTECACINKKTCNSIIDALKRNDIDTASLLVKEIENFYL